MQLEQLATRKNCPVEAVVEIAFYLGEPGLGPDCEIGDELVREISAVVDYKRAHSIGSNETAVQAYQAQTQKEVDVDLGGGFAGKAGKAASKAALDGSQSKSKTLVALGMQWVQQHRLKPGVWAALEAALATYQESGILPVDPILSAMVQDAAQHDQAAESLMTGGATGFFLDGGQLRLDADQDPLAALSAAFRETALPAMLSAGDSQ